MSNTEFVYNYYNKLLHKRIYKQRSNVVTKILEIISNNKNNEQKMFDLMII